VQQKVGRNEIYGNICAGQEALMLTLPACQFTRSQQVTDTCILNRSSAHLPITRLYPFLAFMTFNTGNDRDSGSKCNSGGVA